MKRYLWGLGLLGWIGGASAAGLYTPGFPLAGSYPNTYPPTGNETFPLDTNLPAGVDPQTEAMTLSQLAGYLSGGGATFGAAFPPTGAAIGAYNGGNMVYLGADASHNLQVNCVLGCSASSGTFNNNSDAVATSATNGQAAAWLYAFNGTTWDRLRDDGGKNLYVNLATALPVGGNVIGGVTQSGAWNIASITGSQTLPTGASTSALQSATQGTVGAGAAATASTLAGGIYNSSPITLTNGQGAALQTDANGYLKINVSAGGGAGGTSSTFGAAFPSLGTAIGGYNGSNMVYLAADSSHNLQVNCAVGCSSSGGSSLADEGTFTQGTTSFTVVGGFYSASPVALTSGQGGAVQLTSDRQMYVNLGKVAGTTTSVGAGVATGGGVQRVVEAQDTTTIAGSAPGTAGTPSTNVVSVQGVASGTALGVTLSGTNNINAITGSQVLPTGASTSALQSAVQGPVGPGTAASNSLLMGGIYNSSPPSVTTGQQVALQTDSSGNVKISCQSGCSGSGGTAAADESTFTQGTTSLTPIGGAYFTSVTNLTAGQTGVAQMTTDRMLYVNLGKVGGTSTLTGAGAVGTGAQRMAVAQDTTTVAGSSPGTAGSASSNVVTVQGISSMTPITTALATGTTTAAAVTITTGNTFQSALASSGTRKGCLVQYTGTGTGYVFFGATVSATKATSLQLAPGASASCNISGLILTDNIAVTSATTSDTFVVNSQ